MGIFIENGKNRPAPESSPPRPPYLQIKLGTLPPSTRWLRASLPDPPWPPAAGGSVSRSS